MAFCEELSLCRSAGAASSVLQFKNFIFYLDLVLVQMKSLPEVATISEDYD